MGDSGVEPFLGEAKPNQDDWVKGPGSLIWAVVLFEGTAREEDLECADFESQSQDRTAMQ